MRKAIRCSRCHGGAVSVQGALSRGCQNFLGREASERWMSEWWQEQPALEYLRTQQQQHRRRRQIPLTAAAMAVLGAFFVVTMAVFGAWGDLSGILVGAVIIGGLELGMFALTGVATAPWPTSRRPDDDTEQADR
jgi:hypothetical protein